MKQEKSGENEELNKQFHPAFCDAVIQIFEQDPVEYGYEKEYNLNTMPNRIDLLIIKKNGDARSGTAMGKLFKTHNIFEYKSPAQELDEDEYYLTMAYAYLYSAYEKDVKPDEITLSFVREGRPDKLMEYFREKGFGIIEYAPGIYHVKKKEHIDMQIVVTRELGKEYAWLKALTDKLTKEDVMYLAGEAAKETDPAGKRRLRSILDLVSLLNRKKEWMKEMVGMGAFRDLFQDEFDRKDKEIQNLNEQLQSQNKQLQSKDEQLQNQSEQLQSKDEQLQNQSEQLQSKDQQLQNEKEENTKLRQEIERLKKQMKEQMGKIAML